MVGAGGTTSPGTPGAVRVTSSPVEPRGVADRPVGGGQRTPAWLAASASTPTDGGDRRYSSPTSGDAFGGSSRGGSGGGGVPDGGRRYSGVGGGGGGGGGRGGPSTEASWDAAVARMGSASPGGLLRRLTTPRASLPGDYAVLEAARAESALREVALAVGTPDGRQDGPDVEAAKKAAAKAEKELKKKIKVRWGAGGRGGGRRRHPGRARCLLTRARVKAAVTPVNPTVVRGVVDARDVWTDRC